MSSFVVCDDLKFLRNQFADRLDAHPMQDWDAPLLAAVIALFDLLFRDVGAQPAAPVLWLVPK